MPGALVLGYLVRRSNSRRGSRVEQVLAVDAVMRPSCTSRKATALSLGGDTATPAAAGQELALVLTSESSCERQLRSGLAGEDGHAGQRTEESHSALGGCVLATNSIRAQTV